MLPVTDSAFALPDRLAHKARPELVAADERHLAAVSACVERTVADLADRLAAVRRAPGGRGQAAVDRDAEIHRLTGRLRLLRRFGRDLCLGRVVPADGGEPLYVGRLGLADADGRRLLVDWRSPAAEPFFAATPARPMGLSSRRRYRWAGGRVVDYWDESLVPGGGGPLALDDESAVLAALATGRSARMQDVLATIQADQDAIVRAGSRGALVVAGGPGTGKTVVALHRAAYLLHADPHLGPGRGGVLVVGPHRPYLAYVADVLPSLGEEGVATCTLRDLVPEGAAAGPEPDAEVARLKGSAAMVAAVEPAVRFSERPPTTTLPVPTPWADLRVDAAGWAEAFAAPDPGTPHNEARDAVHEALVELLVAQAEDELGAAADVDAHHGAPDSDAAGLREQLRRSLRRHPALTAALDRAWPLLDAPDLVADLWSVPAYLRLCAPWLTPDEVRALQRDEPSAWTVADLPLLDAARRRLGDPAASRRRRRQDAAIAAERAYRAEVTAELVAADDDDLGVVRMLHGADLEHALVREAGAPADRPDALAGPFAHVVVDEAQELTDAEWQMLLARCPSGSLTVVGDRAQARRGFPESWAERLDRVGLREVRVASLTLGYRTPAEVMAEAEPVIRAVLPDAEVPTAVRRTGVPVRHGSVAERDEVLAGWLADHGTGTACVIGDPAYAGTDRVRSLTAEGAKGLEFDLVVLVEPAAPAPGVAGAVDRYVAMTRATQRLVVLTR